MNFSKAAWRQVVTYSFTANYDGDILDDIRQLAKTKKAFNVVDGALANTYSVNTHLHPTSDRVRILQMVDLLNWRVSHSEQAMVLSGDFNMDPNSFEHSFVMKILNLDDSMLKVNGHYPSDFCSYCASNPLGWLSDDHTFDYVFFSHLGAGQIGWVPQKIQIAMTGNGKPLSDHFGLRVDFQSGEGAVAVKTPEQAQQEMLVQWDFAMLKVMHFGPAIDLGYMKLMLRIRSEVLSGQGPYGQYFQKIFQQK